MFLDVSLFSFSNYPFSTYEKFSEKLFQKEVSARRGIMSVYTKVPANIYLFKVNNKNNRKRCEKCSKLTIKTPQERP